MVVIHVIVRQSHIKWVFPGRKSDWNKILPFSWIILASVVAYPIYVPSTLGIRNRIVFGRLFSNPKYRGHNLVFPSVTSVIRIPNDG